MGGPSQLALFAGVAWRAWVATVVGGFVVGGSAGLGFLLFDDESSAVAVPGVGLIGAAFGMLFGFVPASVVAGFVVAAMSPSRSSERLVELTRWVATGVVGVFVAWLASGLGFSMVMLMTFVPAVGLAWWWAPLTVAWAVDRRADGDDPARATTRRST